METASQSPNEHHYSAKHKVVCITNLSPCYEYLQGLYFIYYMKLSIYEKVTCDCHMCTNSSTSNIYSKKVQGVCIFSLPLNLSTSSVVHNDINFWDVAE